MNKYEVVIIGGGPGGLTAGLYASRAGLKTLLIERAILGGQILNARLVENYPGFPDGITGFELGSLIHRQATKYGLETTNAEVTSVVPGRIHVVTGPEGDIEASSIIIASGSTYRKLGVTGEDVLLGRGVSYCATCDGFLFREREVVVVGGGDTAVTDALELSEHAAKVYLIHRRDQLRAGHVLQQRAFQQPKMHFVWDTVVEGINGDQAVSGLRLRNLKTGVVSDLQVSGVFVAVGIEPNSQPFAGAVKLNETGHIVTDHMMATSVPGIFAAGDVRANSVRQVAAAVGDGATAAVAAFKYLRERA